MFAGSVSLRRFGGVVTSDFVMDRHKTSSSRSARLILLARKENVDENLHDKPEEKMINNSSILGEKENNHNETPKITEMAQKSVFESREQENVTKNNEAKQTAKTGDTNEMSDRHRNPTQVQTTEGSTLFSSSDDGDFGSSSSDDFIPGTDSSSDDSLPPNKKHKKLNAASVPVCVEETESSSNETEIPLHNEAGCSFWDRNSMTSQGKKRKARKSEKERREDRQKRLLLRNKGLEYTTKKGKTRKAREFQDLDDCRQKCKERITPELRKKVFEDYWNLGSYTKRAEYMKKCIELYKKKTKKTSPKKFREFSNRYYIFGLDLQKHRICKKCFTSTFDETHRFIQTICEKIKLFGQTQREPRRHKNTIPNEKLEEIKEHILSFPCTESHYGRSKTAKKFLNCELTLQKIYDLYKEKIINPVSKTIFTKVFNGLNLSFKKPSLDTWSKCDSLKMKLKFTVGDGAVALDEQLKAHQVAYQAAYDQKRADKLLAQSSEEVVVVTFDLQQCLPTPFLKTNVAFYKRQLWTFNLTIHDVKSNKAFCYMWPECTGGRGANDIASCLYDFIMNQLPLLNPRAKHLIMYSDSCSGQNKNSIVTTMLMMAAKLSPQLQTIEHKFLIPGHTHMEADSDHALIERKKKRTDMDIHLPRDWFQLVRTASKVNAKMIVIEMKQDMFYDFCDFSKKYLSLKKSDPSSNKFIWANVRCLKYTQDAFPRFFYKDVHDSTTHYQIMDYSKRGKVYDLITIDIVKKPYTTPLPISAEKKKDLLAFLPFIHESAHEFYHSLVYKESCKDTAPYSDKDSSDE